MPVKKYLFSLFIISLTILTQTVDASRFEFRPFVSGSYQQLLAANNKQAFLLVIWSINCPSCVKDMATVSAVHKARPGIKIIMLSTDTLADKVEAQKIIEKNQLTDIEQWIYADENTQKLQFEIDPEWYGELPRTYFFNKSHERVAYSGVLTIEELNDWITKIIR